MPVYSKSLTRKKRKRTRKELALKGLSKGWNPYKSWHEKHHLGVCGWVGFLAWHFIRGNWTLFEIPNKSFLLYAFIKWKPTGTRFKRNFSVLYFLSLMFRNIVVIWDVFVFNIPYFSIAQYLETFSYNALPRWQKTGMHTPKTHMNKPSEWESTILTLKYSKI